MRSIIALYSKTVRFIERSVYNDVTDGIVTVQL